MTSGIITLLFISVFFSLVIIKFRKIISEKINIIDHPIDKRKIHTQPTPLIGGTIIILNLYLVNLYLILSNQISNLDILVLIFCTISFIIGLIDDIYNISSIKKLFLIAAAYFIITFFDKNLFLKYLYSDSTEKFYYLNFLSIFFTVLCILLLVNAFNLSDGINFLAIMIAIIWLVYIFFLFKNINNSYIIILVSLIIMTPFNFKGEFFLGDSGSLLLGSFIGIVFITNYNQEMDFEMNKISLESIFIIFMIPGIDMFRLFLERILKRKNPFEGDSEHLHHFLYKIYNLKLTLIFYFILITIPILINYNNLIDPVINIILTIGIYLVILNYCKKKLNFIKIKKN